MSKKQWLVLLMLFLAYLLLGASIFYHIESRLEIENVQRAKEEQIEINALLHKHYLMHNQHEILEKLTQYCGKSVYNYTEGKPDPLKWDFYNSFYFAYTVVSTIGYGNLAPTNMLGRILMIFYGLVGIPMNGILLTQLGEFFGHAFVRAHRKYKSYKQEQSRDYCPKKLTSLETRKAGLAAQIFIYLTPGFLMFIFFPAFLFSHYEGWSYDEAVYYAFVTLTTIGFGDYVAGQDNSKGSGIFFIMYKTFLICWISFGLGYIVMIMTFIARGMRSKKITRIEHKLAMNLKHTQSKIWNEFNKEVNYLRRVFNELQLSKVKRVYVNEAEYEEPPAKFPRSNSFPDLRDLLYGGLDSPSPPHPRRRANSEVVPTEDQLTRVVSETDLQRIDKTATFAAHAMVQPAELLARLVNILGYIPPMPPPDDLSESSDWDRDHLEQTLDQELKDGEMRGKAGIDGFSEKEILASESTWNGPTWKLESDGLPAYLKPRSRAVSEVRLQDTKNQANLNQRTWSGPMASKKIQELIKTRRSGLSAIKDGKSYKFPSLSLPKSVPKTLFPRWRRQSTNKKAGPEASEDSASSKWFGMSRGNVGNVGNLETKENYSSQNGTINGTTANAGQFTFNSENATDPAFSKRPYLTHTGANLTNLLEGSNLLEETSLADFLRALTALHSRVGTVPDDYNVRKPQRKMGTACLTPPKLPSLFTLFSPPAAAAALHNGSVSAGHSHQNTVTQLPAQARRFSLRNADGNVRRGSVIPPVAPRRFSLRPVGTPIGTPPNYGSPRLVRQRQRPVLDDNSQMLTNSFLSDSSREPLVRMEGGPGISSPVVSSTNLRRFSLRPAQIGVPPAPANSKPSAQMPGAQPSKALPRWKAGMLQRQIGRASLRRRARAFSLSDVNTEESLSSPGISPLAMDGAMVVGTREFSVRTGRPSTSSVQKTVTIVQPPDSSPYKSSENRNRVSDLSSTADSPGDPSNTMWTDHNPFSPSMNFDGTPSAGESTLLRSHLSTGVPTSGGRTFEFLSPSGNEGGDGPQLSEYEVEHPTIGDALDLPRETRTPPVSDKLTQELPHYQKKDQVASEVKPFAVDLSTISIPDETSPCTSNEAVNVELKRSLQYREDTVIGIDDESIDKNIEGRDGGRKPLKIPQIFQPPNHGRDLKDEDKKLQIKGPGEPYRHVSARVLPTSGSSSASSSRKSSSTRISPPGLKPRVFVDTYKPTLEAKIEKPSVDPFEQYRASMMSRNDQGAPMEVKIEQRQSTSKRELSKSDEDDHARSS